MRAQEDKKAFSQAKMMQFTMDAFLKHFENDVELLKKRYADAVGGYYCLEYHYLPQDYQIIFEHEKLFFSIEIIRKDGAFVWSNQINENINSGLREENIINAIESLKNSFDKMIPIVFYKVKKNRVVEAGPLKQIE